MTTIVTRTGKGSPLTNAEVDANFENLNNQKVEQDSATGAAQLPAGTTAQRPGTPVVGQTRYNSTLGKTETYTATGWKTTTTSDEVDPVGTSLALAIALG